MSENPQFEAPTGEETTKGDEVAASQQFEAPPTESSQSQQAAYVPDSNPLTTGFSTQLLDAHGEIAAVLKQQSQTSGVRTVSLDAAGEGFTNVQGVAIGFGDPGDGPPGEPTLTVFVAERQSRNEVKEYIVDGLGIQSVGDLPLTVRQSGLFEAQPHTFRDRPARGGVSVGHIKVTAGTLGCLSVGRGAPRNNRLMILSNNHVLANSNNAVYGDSIIQPGRYDGGSHPNDQIAILERFIPIKFGGATNYVDAATAWAWPDRVRRELVYPSGSSFNTFRIGGGAQYPALGDVVGKSGRTTQLTQGRVTHVNAAVNVGYGPAGSAHFEGQFMVQGNVGSTFSAGGDSGSVIWKWQSGLPPVGLLFAGGGGYTIANPMPWVTYFLDINLFT
jgi:hypothetical protein